LVFCAPQLIQRLQFHELRKQPILTCFFAFLGFTIFSQVTHAYLWWIKRAILDLALLAIYLMAMLTIVDTPKRLDKLLTVMAGSASMLVLLCMLDFWGVLEFESINKLKQYTEGVDATGKPIYIFRLQGTGLFLDPNDLSQLIGMSGVIFAYFFSRKENGSSRFLWAIPLALMALALVMTQSRGGLLAVGASIMTIVAIHYGRRACIAAALAGVTGLLVVGGRQASVDLSGSTGGARLALWRDGFVSIAGKDAIFGIGYGMYDEVAGQMAHNSFVHAYVESGLVGGTFFFGMFFFAILSIIRMKSAGIDRLPDNLRQFHPYCAALVVGYCVGLCSLSRNYVIPTYQILGVAAVYVNLVSVRLKPPQLLAYVDRPHFYRMLAGSACCFLGFYLMVRIIAR
jgi:O-antigen ligase